MHGGTGDDTLFGAAGDDTLFGEAGIDLLIGGFGNGRPSGGTGSDTFLFESGFGDDVIADFSKADQIWLTANINNSGISNARDVPIHLRDASHTTIKIGEDSIRLDGVGKEFDSLSHLTGPGEDRLTICRDRKARQQPQGGRRARCPGAASGAGRSPPCAAVCCSPAFPLALCLIAAPGHAETRPNRPPANCSRASARTVRPRPAGRTRRAQPRPRRPPTRSRPTAARSSPMSAGRRRAARRSPVANAPRPAAAATRSA